MPSHSLHSPTALQQAQPAIGITLVVSEPSHMLRPTSGPPTHDGPCPSQDYKVKVTQKISSTMAVTTIF